MMHLKGTKKIRVMPAHSAKGILLFACSALTRAQAMLAITSIVRMRATSGVMSDETSTKDAGYLASFRMRL